MSDYSTNSNIFDSTTLVRIQALRRKYEGKVIGFTCSCFDLLHTGHVIMLEDAANQCDVLIVGLQTDPTLDRPDKNKPIQSYQERLIMVRGIRYIDEIVKYATEDDLLSILNTLHPDVRIIGSDWRGKAYTGHELPITMHWHERDHPYSTSGLRKRVYERESENLKR